MGLSGALVGLFLVACTPIHLYAYYNPYLTDGFQLAMLSVMVYALLRGSFAVFAVAGLLGCLARETTILLLPLRVARSAKQGVLLLLAAGAALAMPRLLLPSDPGVSAAAAFEAHGLPRLRAPRDFAMQIAWCWQAAWPISIGGVLLAGRGFRLAPVAYALLFGGAVLSSLLATDVGRMFAILAPFVGLGAATLVHGLWARGGGWWIAALVAITIAEALFGIPNAVLREAVREYPVWIRRGILAAGLLAGAAAVLYRHRDLRAGLRAAPASGGG